MVPYLFFNLGHICDFALSKTKGETLEQNNYFSE